MVTECNEVSYFCDVIIGVNKGCCGVLWAGWYIDTLLVLSWRGGAGWRFQVSSRQGVEWLVVGVWRSHCIQ